MGREFWFGVLALAVALTAAPTANAGLCQYDKTVPGLPKALCNFPSCPVGNFCDPPVINKNSAAIKYAEPLLRWQDSCSDKTLPAGPCWEVYVDFHFELDATDPAGVTAIGAHLSQEVNARRNFRKFFANVTNGIKNINGRYEIDGTMVAHVPPGQRLDIDVYELCARDGAGNEGCVLPTRGGVKLGMN